MDMIADGEAMFEQDRRDFMSIDGTYYPRDSVATYPCKITLVVGKWDVIDATGQIVRVETKDVFVATDDYAGEPRRGDRIEAIVAGSTHVYEVTLPRGREREWSWANRSETLRRVHTLRLATPSTMTLARAIGEHSSASITDDEIRSDLTIDTASSRRMSKAVAPIGQYIYLVLPASFGEPVITTNGLLTTAWEKTTRSITFDGQLARSYSIYRSTYPVAGTVIVGVS